MAALHARGFVHRDIKPANILFRKDEPVLIDLGLLKKAETPALHTGGTVSVNGNSAFDYDGTASFTGGTVYVNGSRVTTLPNQMMGGGGRDNFGGYGGGMNGNGGRGGWH